MSGPTEEWKQRLLRALAENADERVDRLLREACAEAEAEVKGLVKSALAASLLQRAVARVEATAMNGDHPVQMDETVVRGPESDSAPSSDEGPAKPPAEAPEQGCYIYGIVGVGHKLPPQPLIGIDPAFAVRTVSVDDLQAVVGFVGLEEFRKNREGGRLQEIDWLAAKANAHDDVVSGLLAGGPVVPLRFGTVVRRDEDVRQILAQHRDALRELLESLREKREWGVKIFRRSDAFASPTREGRDSFRTVAVEDRAQGSGTTYLVEKRREKLRRNEVARLEANSIQDCHGRLQALSCDTVLLPLHDAARRDAPLVFNGTYLVADPQAESFEATVRTLSEEYEPEGLEFRMTGPWPAYNFVKLDLLPDTL